MSGIAPNPLNDLSKVYLQSIAESAVPGKPAEKLKTDRAGYSIPKADQESAAERIRKKTAEKKAALEKKHGRKMDDHPEYPKKKYVDEKLDPVGQEDKDIDNDGDHDKSDKYLLKRRKAISKAMKKRMTEAKNVHGQIEVPSDGGGVEKLAKKAAKRIDADNDGDVDKDDPKEKGMGEFVPSPDGKKKVRTKMAESRSNWRQDLSEVMTDDIESKQIKEKKVKNTIKINPKLGEAVEQLGGEVIEMVQLDEMPYQVMGSPDGKKEKKVGKPVKSRKYADARAAELADTHKATGGKYRSQYVEEIEIDDIIESVYDELVEEGYSQDEVEYGIDAALNTLEEGYYDSAVAASKAKSQEAPALKRSLKDRIKSVAKKAITRGAYAAGRAMKAKAKVQAAPDRAKKKVRSIADRVKSAAKAGYAAGRGPVEKKSTYRGAGVGRKEKIGEEIEIEEGIGMTMAKAVGNPPALSKRMKLKQALLNREIKKNAAKNKKKSYSGKAAVSEAVKGQDTEMRKAAAAERKKGDKRLSPSAGKANADKMERDVKYFDKVTKKTKPSVVGMTHEEVQVDEKLNMKKEKMGDVIKDFYKSDAPQFKGKSKEKRREMAIAAKLTAERGGKRLGEQQQQEPGQRKMISTMTQLQMKKQQLDRRKLQMKKRGEIPINTESVDS